MAPKTNPSVAAFRKLTLTMQRDVFKKAISTLVNEANALADAMQAAAVRGPTGNLAASIRVEPGRKQTTVVIKAGGSATTAKVAGKPYDYARAVEFGTEHVSAQPFFFTTYRRNRIRMRTAMHRNIIDTIEKYSAE